MQAKVSIIIVWYGQKFPSLGSWFDITRRSFVMPTVTLETEIAVCISHLRKRPGIVAGSEACLLGMQVAPSSIPMSSTFFCWDLVMKTFLLPYSLFRWFKKSSCQLLAEECALNTGKLPRRLVQEQCGQGNWPRPKLPQVDWRAVKQKSNQNLWKILTIYAVPRGMGLRYHIKTGWWLLQQIFRYLQPQEWSWRRQTQYRKYGDRQRVISTPSLREL